METDTTYTPPATLAIMDDTAIHRRMLSVLPADIDQTEGGFASDFTRPAALEKAEMLMRLNDAIQVCFPAWSYGVFLDLLAEQDGLVRRAGTAAEGTVNLTGTPGTTVPAGFVFSTAALNSENIEFAAQEQVTINDEGGASVTVRCTQTGEIGNIAEHTITLMASPMPGISTVDNAQPMTGGTEPEDDDSLRARIRMVDMSGDASYVGNDADYRRWALEVTGVGSALVIPEPDGPGTGTVKLLIMDNDGEPADTALKQAVYNHIMSPDARENRLAPIGAILEVDTATPLQINISASIITTENATIEQITKTFREALIPVFAEASSEGTLRWTRVGAALSNTPGVIDYTDLTLNGAANNISITSDDYPTASSIVFEGASST